MRSILRLTCLLYLIICLGLGARAQQSLSGIINEYASVLSLPSGNACDPNPVFSVSYRSTFVQAKWESSQNRVLIIQMQGAEINTIQNNIGYGAISNILSTGNYEYADVLSATPTTITLKNRLSQTYNDPGSSSANFTSSIQIVLLPICQQDCEISSLVTASDWNGTTGGIVAFDANGKNVNFKADIDVSTLGFRGGERSEEGEDECLVSPNQEYYAFDIDNPAYVLRGGRKGEGVSKGDQSEATFYTKILGRGPLANGGGGGNNHKAGGGGGSNYGGGGLGGATYGSANCSTILPYNGIGGKTLTSYINNGRIFMGGGGGGGHIRQSVYNENIFPQSLFANGANGGGIVFIRNANAITGDAGTKIKANGGDSGKQPSIGESGGGGGGGGSVILDANSVSGIAIEVKGGRGGIIYAECVPKDESINPPVTNEIARIYGPGGGGGGGVVWSKNALSVATDFTGGAPGYNFTNFAAINDPTFPLQYCFEVPYGLDPNTITSIDDPALRNGAAAGQLGKALTGYVAPITIPSTFTVTADSTAIRCALSSTTQSDDGTITITPNGGNPPYSYQIDNGPFQSSPVFTDLGEGPHKIIVKDVNGCYATNASTTNPKFVIINKAILLTINYEDPLYACKGENNGSIRADASGGKPPYLYRIEIGVDVYRDNQSSPYFYNIPVKDGYKLIVIDANGCEKSIFFNIKELDQPVEAGPEFNPTTNPLFCLANPNDISQLFGDPLPLMQTSVYPNGPIKGAIWYIEGYKAESPTFISNSVLLFAQFAQNIPPPYNKRYKLIYEYNGCIDSTFINLESVTLNNPSFVSKCVSELYYTPEPADPPGGRWTSPFGTVMDLDKGTVDLRKVRATNPTSALPINDTLTYSLPSGCSDYYVIEVKAKPTADFTSSPPMTKVLNVPKDKITFTNKSSADAVSFEWLFGDGNTSTQRNPPAYTYEYGDTFDVSLVARDAAGCADTMTKKGLIVEKFATIDVNNVFTPDGDGINDFLVVSGYNVTSIELSVFDRFGVEIFSKKESNNLIEWNGRRYNNDPIPGVYYYKIKVVKFDGKVVERIGTVTLLLGGEK